MSRSETWQDRLTQVLEPILLEDDPRPRLSAYHDMPFAIFHYDARDEFGIRQAIDSLATRLEVAGKRVTRVSLMELLEGCLAAAGVSFADLAEAERTVGLEQTVRTVQEIVSREQPLDAAIADQVPADAKPMRDIVFLTRAGALYGLYRTSAILNRLHRRLSVPVILFYPGTLDGPAGLRFMGVLNPEHDYRPKIF